MTITYLGDSGIVLGQVDDFGVEWTQSGVGPWGESPAPKDVTGDNVNDHGMWDATEFYGPRRYEAAGLAKAPTHDALHQAAERFRAACGMRVRVRHVEPGFDRSATFRRDGAVIFTEQTNLIARFSAPLYAGDPRAYSTAARTGSAAFPSSSGGLTWPATWPATWAATVVDGTMSLQNVGTHTSWPKYRIDGPVVNPRIVNAVTGEQMLLTMTLLAGEWVTINTATHQVLANDDPAASRRDKFSGTWFGLASGTTGVRFAGASAGAGAALSVTYNDIWI